MNVGGQKRRDELSINNPSPCLDQEVEQNSQYGCKVYFDRHINLKFEHSQKPQIAGHPTIQRFVFASFLSNGLTAVGGKRPGLSFPDQAQEQIGCCLALTTHHGATVSNTPTQVATPKTPDWEPLGQGLEYTRKFLTRNVAMNATDTAQAAYDAADDQLADLHKRQQAALSDALAIISAHLPEVPLANGQALHDMVKEAIEESTFEVEQRLTDETEAAGLRLSNIENHRNVVAFQRSVL